MVYMSISSESHSQCAWAPAAARMAREVLSFMMTGLDRCTSHGQGAGQLRNSEDALRSGLYMSLSTTGAVHAAATVTLIVIP